MTRGPDFLPYSMPTAPSPEAAPPIAADAATRSRAELAVAALNGPGIIAVAGGMVALLALLLVSLLLGYRGTGAVLAVLGATVAAVAARRALAQEPPADSATVVTSSRAAGLVSAVLAVLLLLLLRPADAQPPIRIPQPLPSPSASQPQLPTPGPSTGARPPGSGFGFGLPTQPEAPLTQAATDKGTLTGLVVDTAGKPVVGATVVIDRAAQGDTSDAPGCPLRSTARTDSKGAYTVQLCQLGQDLGYQVTVTAAGAIASNQLFINAGRTTRYDVILAIRTS